MVATAVIQYGLGVGLMLAVVAFPIAVVAWLAGLTVIGGPFWWLLRKAKVTPTRLAAGLGGMLAPLVAAGPQAVVSLGHGGYDGSLIFQVVMFAAFGAIVGWVVARVAYPSERTAR